MTLKIKLKVLFAEENQVTNSSTLHEARNYLTAKMLSKFAI